MRDTPYATERATAEIGGHAIERIFVKGHGQEEIRFSWWTNGRLNMRPLDLPESDLLPLIDDAITKGVFTRQFLNDLLNLMSTAKAAGRF